MGMIYQLGSSMLDALVLAIVSEKDTYGYLISQEIKKVYDLKDSAMYPVLRRLQEEGCLDVYDEQYQGRNRRYYKITDTGQKKHQYFIEEWENYKNNIESILLRRGA